jgi:hypothetical protein
MSSLRAKIVSCARLIFVADDKPIQLSISGIANPRSAIASVTPSQSKVFESRVNF